MHSKDQLTLFSEGDFRDMGPYVLGNSIRFLVKVMITCSFSFPNTTLLL
jgi:hypothetical protein